MTSHLHFPFGRLLQSPLLGLGSAALPARCSWVCSQAASVSCWQGRRSLRSLSLHHHPCCAATCSAQHLHVAAQHLQSA